MSLQLALKLGLGGHRKGGGEPYVPPVELPDMILVYAIPSAGTNIQLAIQANSTWFSAGQAAVINWGDGSAAQIVSDTGGSTYIGHTYASAGTYTIKISGSMTMYGRSESYNLRGQTLLTRVDSFGKLRATSFLRAFQGCTGLTSVPKTFPGSVTSTHGMFYNCSGAAFNPDFSNWDVSKVENMYGMFWGCSGAAFNPDIYNWDVSKVTTMANMFSECSGAAFNPDFSNWNVSKVTTMATMFYNCHGNAFNPNVSNWDVSKVENMYFMFGYCSGAAFNPDFSNWDVSKVTTMYYMFYNCSGAEFRGGRGVNGSGIAKWKLKIGNNTVIMTSFMASSKTQAPPFLDEILNAWADLHALGQLPTNITVHFGTNKKYTAAGAAAYTTLTGTVANGGAGWTITSGGLTS